MAQKAAVHRPRSWRKRPTPRKDPKLQALYNSPRWRMELKPQVRHEEPWCRECLRLKRRPPRRTQAVDHIKPHKGDVRLFYDRRNLQGLCFVHHNQKTARHDGGFGRRRV